MRRGVLLAGFALLAMPAAAAPRRRGGKPAAVSPAKEPVPPQPSKDVTTGSGAEISTVAPVPNRDLEAPRAADDPRARLGPGVINRDMPGRGLATEGSPTLLEDKLFKPIPGARLNVPFSY